MNRMTLEEFKELCVGDLVTIRDYNEMIADETLTEYTTSIGEWISATEGVCFNEEKKQMCGETFIIYAKSCDHVYILGKHTSRKYNFPLSTLASPAPLCIDESIFDALLGGS